MQLVYAHRLAHEIARGAAAHIALVRPFIAPAFPDPGGGVFSVLAPRGKGVGLQYLMPVGAGDAEFIKNSVGKPLDKADPYSAVDVLHRSRGAIPRVEIADETDPLRIRRPDDKAVRPKLRNIAAAETQPRLARAAGIEKIHVLIRYEFFLSVVHVSSPPLKVSSYLFIITCFRRNSK